MPSIPFTNLSHRILSSHTGIGRFGSYKFVARICEVQQGCMCCNAGYCAHGRVILIPVNTASRALVAIAHTVAPWLRADFFSICWIPFQSSMTSILRSWILFDKMHSPIHCVNGPAILKEWETGGLSLLHFRIGPKMYCKLKDFTSGIWWNDK